MKLHNSVDDVDLQTLSFVQIGSLDLDKKFSNKERQPPHGFTLKISFKNLPKAVIPK
jgi:hypothetical protein